MTLQVTYVSTSQLNAYKNNPKTHSEKQVQEIASSISEFGFVNPILVGDDNVVIAGHGRLMAAQKLALKQVPVIYLAGLSERQRRALVIADNKIAQNSGWDFSKLGDELSALIDADFDINMLGFDEQEIDALLKDDANILPADMYPAPAPAWPAPAAPSQTDAPGPLTPHPGDAQEQRELIPLGASVAMTSVSIKKFTFERYFVPLTDDEHAALTTAIENYLETYGTLTGFVSRHLSTHH